MVNFGLLFDGNGLKSYPFLVFGTMIICTFATSNNNYND